jgi:hypothetical protein
MLSSPCYAPDVSAVAGSGFSTGCGWGGGVPSGFPSTLEFLLAAAAAGA